MENHVKIIGGGLAGSEAAWQLANAGFKVRLYEMRNGTITTEAHRTSGLAELVCSNSFRNDDIHSAIGLLHQEMRLSNSLIMTTADKCQVPAGTALSVDRVLFSENVEKAIMEHQNIEIIREEVASLEDSVFTIIATGPLTSEKLSNTILSLINQEYLSFFDSIAPIIYKDSINFDIAWLQSRYNKPSCLGETSGDYINCPMNKEQYENFVNELLHSECMEFKEWEKNTPYFEGCLPIEVMASRGVKTLSFGPMKPVGLDNPNNPDKSQLHAVVQLRQDNTLGTIYNMVGFQTKMKYGEQKRIFRTIPALENAEFARLGGIHRNTFINSPSLLNKDLSLQNVGNIHFAGQITGVEGYVESAAMGLLCGRFISNKMQGRDIVYPDKNTAMGALLRHISETGNSNTFQPMNINFGLFSDTEQYKKHNKKEEIAKRAIAKINEWNSESM